MNWTCPRNSTLRLDNRPTGPFQTPKIAEATHSSISPFSTGQLQFLKLNSPNLSYDAAWTCQHLDHPANDPNGDWHGKFGTTDPAMTAMTWGLGKRCSSWMGPFSESMYQLLEWASGKILIGNHRLYMFLPNTKQWLLQSSNPKLAVPVGFPFISPWSPHLLSLQQHGNSWSRHH